MVAVVIHGWALVDDPEKIGEGTKVWQFASVIRGAAIGKDCTIGPWHQDRRGNCRGSLLHSGRLFDQPRREDRQ
jgi:bifunctional N-acetylglucosamine-1-phosphate-uridyltransferase/glucosamine-1-phosphate-acetyltransferase GlmU-like protein